MANKVNLVDLNFKSLPVTQKREAFILMDAALKRLHAENYMVTDFNARKVYFEDGIYFFDEVSPISYRYVENEEEAILNNVLGLSNLALCSYLPDYRLEYGLLNFDVISNNFDNFSSYFVEDDADYYKSILVDSYKQSKLPELPYYTDYIINKGKDKKSSHSNVYVKATEAGRALANQDEAAFGHKFFFLTVVFSVTILLIGLIYSFWIYLG